MLRIFSKNNFKRIKNFLKWEQNPPGLNVPGTLYIIAILFLTGTACGGIHKEKFGQNSQHSPLNLPAFWSGQWIGRQIIQDRNGNLMETAHIERSCRRQNDIQGECTDKIYYYFFQMPQNPQTKQPLPQYIQNGKLNWQIVYRDNSIPEIKIKVGGGELNGTLYHTQAYFKGETPLPRKKEKLLSTILRYHRLPGPEEQILEMSVYSMWGFQMGQSQTLWSKRKEQAK